MPGPTGVREAAASEAVSERTPLLRRALSETAEVPRLPGGSNGQQSDIDAKLKRWRSAVAAKFKLSSKSNGPPQAVRSVFGAPGEVYEGRWKDPTREPVQRQRRKDAEQLEFEGEIAAAKEAIAEGLQPRMVAKGTSGSYFVRARIAAAGAAAAESSVKTVAIFKPKDEEPYGTLNPKRKFLRKYFWWAMGRPCLIPNFSYLSEAGASYLNNQLGLDMVPPTTLVELSSPVFSYEHETRRLYHLDAAAHPLPDKIGSYQRFLHGFVNVSDFLRQHPWPPDAGGRPKSVQERDFKEEARAHKKARKRSKHRLRTCTAAVTRFVLCRQGIDEEDRRDRWQQQSRATSRDRDSDADLQRHRLSTVDAAGSSGRIDGQPDFEWTPPLMESFRLELEKLVILDYLMRNTDRGLDNAMVQLVDTDAADATSPTGFKQRMKIGAIDNSLSFPHSHPSGMREYPFGWLWLPSSLIGQPFSAAIRAQLLPVLDSPLWWSETVAGLRAMFQKDRFFSESTFDRQVALLKGQAWNIIQSLRNEEEGPLELCARPKKLIKTDRSDLPLSELFASAAEAGESVLLLDPTIRPPPDTTAVPDTTASSVPRRRASAVSVPAPGALSRATTAPGKSIPTVGSMPKSLPALNDPMAELLRKAGSRRRAMSPQSTPKRRASRAPNLDEPPEEGAQLGIDVVTQLEHITRKSPPMRRIASHAPRHAAQASLGTRSIEGVLASVASLQDEGARDEDEEADERTLSMSVPSLSAGATAASAADDPRKAYGQRVRGSTFGASNAPLWHRGFSQTSFESTDQAEPRITTLIEVLKEDKSRALLKWY